MVRILPVNSLSSSSMCLYDETIFSGNSNLVYTIIRKRHVFHQLANLPTDHHSIANALSKKGKRLPTVQPPAQQQPSMEGAQPASEAEPGTLKATLEVSLVRAIAIRLFLF